MTTTYKPGQRLTLAHDNGTVLQGTVVSRYNVITNRDDLRFNVEGLGDQILESTLNAFEVTHVDGKPVSEEPELPTKPGLYRSSASSDVDGTLRLLVSGQWEWVGNHHRTSPELIAEDRVRLHSPLTRLGTLDEHRPVIAREVIEWASSRPGVDPNARIWSTSAEHFNF